MLNEVNAKKIIRKIIKRSFFDYFIDKKEPDTQHILLAKLFPDEMRTSSIIQGIQTSLGTTLWEKIALEFALNSGFKVLNPRELLLRPNPIPNEIVILIEKYRVRREDPNSNIKLSVFSEDLARLIKKVKISKEIKFEPLIKGSGADIFLTRGKNEFAFDLKTVQINAGSGPKFNQTFLYWIAFRSVYNLVTDTKSKNFKAFLAIPYNPYINSDWWTQMKGRAYPLDINDIMVGDTFWNFVANNNNAGNWLNQEIISLNDSGFSDIYKGLLKGNTLDKSINLVTSQFNVSHKSKISSSTDLNSRLIWECKSCGQNFEKKLNWFKKNHACTHCFTDF